VLLPSPTDIPGRAIWQHVEEREVQVMHLPMADARKRLQERLSTAAQKSSSSSPSSFFLDSQPGRFVIDEGDLPYNGG
jgi:hypothetical protein